MPHTDSPGSESLEIGSFVFDPSTGELRGAGGTQRLPPQPAQLLALLAAHAGELVSREQIRAALWPDVQVEFDQGLHQCIRQLRTALGDSAAQATYIQTLPRRGYRLLPDVRVIDNGVEAPEPPRDAASARSALSGETSNVESGGPRPSRRRRRIIATALGVAAIVIIGSAGLATLRGGPPSVAVMPFIPPASSAFPVETRFVADHLVELLGNDPDLRVIGPTTTSRYESVDTLLRSDKASRPPFVINGRFIDDDHPRLLVELIRTADGAHVWVQAFEDLSDPREMARVVAAAVMARL